MSHTLTPSLPPDRPLIFSHAGRWRMAQVLMISIFGQFSGNGLGYFNTVIFANIGVNTVSQQLGYNLLTSVVSAIGAGIAVTLTDKMLRRPVLVFGTLACAATLAVNSGLSAALDKQQREDGEIQTSYAKGALAAYFLFNVVFSFTYTPLQAAVPTEALETTMRAKGLAASAFIVNAMNFINQFAGPIALQNIGYKYIYIFVGWDIIEALMWYIFGYVSAFVLGKGHIDGSCAANTPLLGLQCRIPRSNIGAAGMGVRPAEPSQGVAQGRQGHCAGRWQSD